MKIQASSLMLACVAAMCVVINSAPVPACDDEGSLTCLIKKANLLLDQLLERTKPAAKEDIPPALREQDVESELEERNEDGNVPFLQKGGNRPFIQKGQYYADRRNEDGNVPFLEKGGGNRPFIQKDTRNEDGAVPFIAKSSESEKSTEDLSLRDAIAMLEALRERKHHSDIGHD